MGTWYSYVAGAADAVPRHRAVGRFQPTDAGQPDRQPLAGLLLAEGVAKHGKNQLDADLLGVKDRPELVARVKAHVTEVASKD